jgi:predicted phosphodiesterase
MRVAVVSDIHGNLAALDAVIEDISGQGVDDVWCGGDIAWGAWPGAWANGCIERVRDLGWKTVKGNTDIWLTGDPQVLTSAEARSANEEMARAHGISTEDARWLVNLPLGHSAPGSVLLVHARPDTPFDAPGPTSPTGDFEAYQDQAALVIYGHVHHAFVRRVNDRTVVANTGSVGAPLDAPTACYMLLDQSGPNWTIVHRRVDYDREGAIEAARKANAPVAETFLGYLNW